MIRSLALLLLATVTSVYAQSAAPSKLDEFQSKHGFTYIRAYSEIEPTSIYVRIISVQPSEYISYDKTSRLYGVRVSLGTVASSFVDDSELDELIKGFDYLLSLNKSITKLDEFEATYNTKGGLTIGVYSSDKTIKGEYFLFMVGNSRNSERFKIDYVKAIRQLFVDAKAKLDQIRQ